MCIDHAGIDDMHTEVAAHAEEEIDIKLVWRLISGLEGAKPVK